jgi:hypothetical protein
MILAITTAVIDGSEPIGQVVLASDMIWDVYALMRIFLMAIVILGILHIRRF